MGVLFFQYLKLVIFINFKFNIFIKNTIFNSFTNIMLTTF